MFAFVYIKSIHLICRRIMINMTTHIQTCLRKKYLVAVCVYKHQQPKSL